MNCPHCHEPIDPALVRKAANTDAAGRARPGAKGQAKTGCKHVAVCSHAGDFCRDCKRPLRWSSKRQRWRIDYYAPKQKSPAA